MLVHFAFRRGKACDDASRGRDAVQDLRLAGKFFFFLKIFLFYLISCVCSLFDFFVVLLYVCRLSPQASFFEDIFCFVFLYVVYCCMHFV